MKRIKLLSLILTVCMLCAAVCGCGTQESGQTDSEIVVLFTNDIHCCLEGNITLSQIAAYKSYLETKCDNVLLVDCGDAVQGSSLGTVSEGGVLIDAMNAAGYDYAIFGNHEFDYGQARLKELVESANAQYLCCNVTNNGTGDSALPLTKPYAIVECGDKSVAFVGVTTPLTIGSSTPSYFMENGEYVFDFCGGTTNEALIACVQKNVDEARANGADYVILLAHLGCDADSSIFSSDLIIEGTNGIDAVLDAHSHEVYTKVSVKNKDGVPVTLAQTGTKLANLGQLVISSSGIISVTMIDELPDDDETVKAEIDTLTAEYEELFNKVVAHTDVALSDRDENGVRTVRNRETALGDFCADAYRAVLDADIAYLNGGGIRATIDAGDVTYQDLINVNPYGNMLCLTEVTGQELLDMLEYFVRSVQPESVSEDNKTPVGEDGSFPNMSGITFTVDTRIESPVIVDENDMLVGVDDTKTRRVSDVMIESDGEYLPLDVTKTYTLASHNYMICNGGCGMEHYLAGHTLLQDCVMSDYQALITYAVNELNGDLSGYNAPAGRITFIR